MVALLVHQTYGGLVSYDLDRQPFPDRPGPMILDKTTKPISQDWARAAQPQPFYYTKFPLDRCAITKPDISLQILISKNKWE